MLYFIQKIRFKVLKHGEFLLLSYAEITNNVTKTHLYIYIYIYIKLVFIYSSYQSIKLSMLLGYLTKGDISPKLDLQQRNYVDFSTFKKD